MTFPEPVEISRTIDHRNGAVVSVRGGFVFNVLVRLSDGRLVRYFEAERDGMLAVCETRRDAFEALRHG